jgi:DNA-binding beta-propeller fold protein YncE
MLFMNWQRNACRCVLSSTLIGSICTYAQESQALSLIGRIDLAGVEGRIDHFSVDVKSDRLFMSALGNHTLEVIDIRSGKRLRTLSDLPEPQGVYYDTSSNHIFVACARDGSTRIFDGSTFALLKTVSFPANADNVRYDPRTQRIIVGYGSGALAFFDSNGNKSGEIALDGHPESFQLEKAGSRVFVNIPNSQEIQIADLSKNQLIGKWQLTSATRNFPMALD